jgi:hypothetical protein
MFEYIYEMGLKTLELFPNFVIEIGAKVVTTMIMHFRHFFLCKKKRKGTLTTTIIETPPKNNNSNKHCHHLPLVNL